MQLKLDKKHLKKITNTINKNNVFKRQNTKEEVFNFPNYT